MAEQTMQVNVRIPERIARQLRLLAEVDRVSQGAIVEEALTALIDWKRGDAGFQERHAAWVAAQQEFAEALA